MRAAGCRRRRRGSGRATMNVAVALSPGSKLAVVTIIMHNEHLYRPSGIPPTPEEFPESTNVSHFSALCASRLGQSSTFEKNEALA